jgi:hypothetical protein
MMLAEKPYGGSKGVGRPNYRGQKHQFMRLFHRRKGRMISRAVWSDEARKSPLIRTCSSSFAIRSALTITQALRLKRKGSLRLTYFGNIRSI